MAISIVSDLVLDVVKAANPERARIAQAGLQRGPAATSSAREYAEAENTVKRATGIGRFLETDIVGDVVNAADPSRLQTSIVQLAGERVDMASLVLNANDPEAATANPKAKAYEQFEASILRNFVEGMLPKSADSVYGEGTAGNVWRSMQADFMSQELAKSGGIGIAATLAKLDEAKARSQPDVSLNEISPKAGGASGSLSSASEWPYFSRSKIGVLES